MKYPKTFGRPEAVWNKHGGEEGIDRFLRGETIVVPVGHNILTIDRSVKPTWPVWTKETMHPEFENTGPTHLDPSTIIPYYHPEQKNGGRIGGTKLYEFLNNAGLIEHCLDLRVGEEFVKHPSLFPLALDGKAVFLWKSVVLSLDGSRRVPYVIGDAGRVCVVWLWIASDLCDRSPAGLSAS